MPLTLDTPIAVNTTVNVVKITSFAIDLDRLEMFVAYDELNVSEQRLGQKTITITGPDFSAAIVAANTAAGADVYAAIKSSLYAQIQLQTGTTGVVL